MSTDLDLRLHRLYHALGQAFNEDLSEVRPVVTRSPGKVTMSLSFGEFDDAETQNAAHVLIHAVAHLPNHLHRRFHGNASSLMEIRDAMESSAPLQVLTDLSNNDKHGYPPRDGGLCGRAPRLEKVVRAMRLSSGSEPGSGASITMIPFGIEKYGSGSAKIVITGDIVDRDGNEMGKLDAYLERAVADLESLLIRLGIRGGGVTG